jgi:flagellar basal-body rod protein FlgB
MNLFDVETRALKICESRATLLAGNIANASTPHYKARDIDFHRAMQKANESVGIMRTDEKHLGTSSSETEKIGYRVPMQFRLDENTVDDEFERKNFIENSIKYQAGLGFAQNKVHNLIRALRGE